MRSHIFWAVGGAAALALMVWFVWSSGFAAGEAAEMARNEAQRKLKQHELFQLADRLSDREAELERYRSAQFELSQEMEDAARADPDNARPGIGAAGLRRLERRWRTAH
ncbi:hypothetical protein [Tritonibacter mobilis]|uniref:hypothetical protein n=1 Tax=Tritonibacter mobilis TaxID=379347 RepID=UPI000806AF7D|nr:hypothetical protein [Tritonibacter mobilis]